LVRSPGAAQIGEFKYLFGASSRAMIEAGRNFWFTGATEMPALERTLGQDPGTVAKWDIPKQEIGKYTMPSVAIGGKTGRTIRWPQRGLGAFDQLFKSFSHYTDVAAQAYRIAKDEGLTGEVLGRRVDELLADKTSLAHQRAYEFARDVVFMQEGGEITQRVRRGVLSFREKLDFPVYFFLPFVSFAVNSGATGIRKSPLGVLSLARRTYQAAVSGDWSKVPKGMAEQFIAWSFVLAVASTLDDDDPWITGSLTAKELAKYYGGEAQLANRTFKPYSIRIPGTDIRFKYDRIEPLTYILATTVDLINIANGTIKHKDAVKTALDLWKSLAGQVKSKSFLRGMSEFIDVIMDPEGKGRNWATNFAVSIGVPNLVRATVRGGRDYIPERRLWGKGEERTQRAFKRIGQKTELGLYRNIPKYDIWGRPIKSSALLDAHASDVGYKVARAINAAYRATVPIEVHREDIFVGDRLLLNWNKEHPDDDQYLGEVKPEYTRKGKKYYMTDEQFAQFSRDAGRMAASRVLGAYNRGKLNIDNPTRRDVKILKDIVSSSRKAVRNRIKPLR
jgi:hypothetical protein